MRIQKIEIQGFKSFADRTTIHFGKGITGVVGPNGCGKSNIVDAIRWVMGEQSARYLRGGSMQDVIFNGSDVRGPMGMAEVSLTLENDGQGVPPEYTQYSEIQVTRRLFRDGDSDYEINKTACRLKDIHDLFLGTGVGNRAYSIIAQGQVAEIMRVKPEDRRRIIEEAAGITKYKARKDAAIRKMEATRQNLQRIDDVTKEIGRRLGGLRRQARKAERYQELKTQLKEIELHHATLRFFELTNGINFDQAEMDRVNASLSGDVERLATLEAEIDAKRQQHQEKERAHAEKQARLYEIENGRALAEQSADHALREFERSKKRDEEAALEVTAAGEQLAMIKGARAELARGKDALEEEANSDEGALSNSQGVLDEMKQRRHQEASRVEDVRKQVIARSTDAAKAASDVFNLKGQIAELTQRKEAVATEKDPLTEERVRAAELGQSLDADRQKADADKAEADAARQAALAQIQDKKRVLSDANKVLGEAKDALQKKRSRLSSLEEIHARYEQSPEAVRNLLKRGGVLEGKGKLFVDLFEAKSELELPIEAALGARLQAIVVADEETAVTALAALAEAGNRQGKGKETASSGRADLLVEATAMAPAPITLEGARGVLEGVKAGKGKKLAPVVEAVLGRVFLVDDVDTARLLWADASKQGATLVTADGSVFFADGVIRGGSTAGADSGVLRQKRELRELADEVQVLEVSVQEKQVVVDELSQALSELDEQQRQASERGQALSVKLAEIKGAQKRQIDDLNRIEQRLKRLQDDEGKVDVGIEKAAADLEKRQTDLQTAEQERQRLESELQGTGEVLIALDAQIAEQQERVTTMKVRAASVAERRETLQKSLEQNERTEAELEARLLRLQRQIEQGHGEREILTKTEAEARGQIAVLTTERVEVKAALEEARTQAEAVAEAVRMQELEARGARQTLDAAREKHSGLILRLRERELELDAVVDRCIERHRVRPEEILFDYHLKPQLSEDAFEKQSELDKQIESLGAINLTAIDECKELEGRHEFLRTQADDLTHALNQLEKAIVKINRTTKKRFQETFEGINERFQQVFPRLFRGGKAWLSLTDPNDLLATGVEIFAQPPGKKVGSVALMSGGEQALTAVSLIFAIFLLRPSPFCLLDEVDAPLDEANVGRFNDIVRDISQLSQFIVITHNKKTMEVADQLYGITMEEPGISKTVNVRIQ